MTWNEFKGAAKRIDDIDLPRIGAKIGVGEDEIHAIIDVEARGSGFDSIGRPAMLFESHWFHRLLKGQERADAVKRGLAHKSWKEAKAANRKKYGSNYPKESYTRLKQAMEINETAALSSASWGMGQIMGFNHEAAGYSSVQEMVLDFMDDEENHLEAMINFIIANGLDDELRRHDWRGFARGYNGAGYAKNNYHTKLANSYAKWSRIKDTPWHKGMKSDPAPHAPLPPPMQNEAETARTKDRSTFKVYLFRGLLGAYYSAGLDTLAAKLKDKGYAVSVHPFGAGVSVREKIAAEYANGTHSGFAIIGHSLGANAALRVAKKLSTDGVPIRYVASIDPTFRFSVSGFVADNFRSHDIRDKPVEGASEIKRDDLSHIEIDDDVDVHNRIIDQCNAMLRAASPETKDRPMPQDPSPSPTSILQNEELVAALLALVLKNKSGDSSDQSEIMEVLRIILASKGVELPAEAQTLLNAKEKGTAPIVEAIDAEPLTTVNKALGEKVGRLLNGRKSAIGIVGLLATYLIPAIAPQATVLVDILKAIGLEGAATIGGVGATPAEIAATASPAKSIFGPIFSAMLAWGGLGKLDKWFKLRRLM